MTRRSRRRRIVAGAAVLAAALAIIVCDRIFPPPLERGAVVSPVVLDRAGHWISASTVENGRWRFQAHLDRIDPLFVERLLTVEDARFLSHWGVDPLALVRAAHSALAAGRIVSGGSTLTMQTARLLEPRARTVGSKLIEMIRAVQIEARLSKRQILELYLTLTPYGGNLEGVRAASLIYFGHEPDSLSEAEAALLIALPQSPEARRPDRRPDAAAAARARVLDKLVATGRLTDQQGRQAKEAGLPTRQDVPRYAFHFARRVAAAAGRADEIATTLDLGLQIALEDLARSSADQAGDGANVAAIVVANADRSVRAYVGSARFGLKGGWIDMVRAARSPGSTLKPFIFGLAFDDGLAAPGTLIDDRPQRFGGYMPENFDKQFRGEVRVREALQHSLNVPAVAALDGIGPTRFLASLRASGVSVSTPRRADETPGLALALGGAGLSAFDLAVLYSGLANDGRVAPLNLTAPETDLGLYSAYQLMSPRSARRIRDILRQAPSPAGRVPASLTQGAPEIAFKTGTSYGFRDAWAVGVSGNWTVVVWVGRPDGGPRPGQTGRAAALPILFDAFDLVPDRGRSERLAESDAPAPRGLRRFQQAKASGPEIVFPPDGAELMVTGFGPQARGVALAARGGHGPYRWYVDGEPIEQAGPKARSIWRPDHEGFYDVAVFDASGLAQRSKVRVKSFASGSTADHARLRGE